jgi:hypothetical protein
MSAYAYLGGSTPYGKTEMVEKVVIPAFGKNFDTHIQFDDEDYYDFSDKLDKKYDVPMERNGWKHLYSSASGQGTAWLSKDGKFISASILAHGGIIGAIYEKKRVSKKEDGGNLISFNYEIGGL